VTQYGERRRGEKYEGESREKKKGGKRTKLRHGEDEGIGCRL